MTTDEHWMKLAIDLAEIGRGQTSPNPLVGAVVVKDGLVVGQGAHLKAGQPHAEVNALNMAGPLSMGATIYVSLEPCNHHGRTPPCTEAIIRSGISRVVIAAVDHDTRTRRQGIARLCDAGIDVSTGVLESLANRQNRAFFHRVDTGRPLVIYKSAATLSGHVAASNGHSQFVTGEAARRDVQRMRMAHAGIAVGSGTVLADNPRLTVRSAEQTLPAERQPLRVIFDGRARIPVTASLLREPGNTLILVGASGAQTAAEKIAALRALSGIEVAAIEEGNGRMILSVALQQVAEAGVNSLLVEGGPTLAGALLEAGMMDEVCLYFAPKLLASGLPMLQGTWTASMQQSINLDDVRYTPVGSDLRVDAQVRYGALPRNMA